MISLCDLTRPPALSGDTSFPAPTELSILGHLHLPAITQSVGPLPSPTAHYRPRRPICQTAGFLSTPTAYYRVCRSVPQAVGPLPNPTVHCPARRRIAQLDDASPSLPVRRSFRRSSAGPLPNPATHYSIRQRMAKSAGPSPTASVCRRSRIPNRSPILSRQALPPGRWCHWTM